MVGEKVELQMDGDEVVENAGSNPQAPQTFAEAVEDAGAMLAYRLEQQAALSNFGMQALQSSSIPELLESAVHAAALGMRASLSKILEYRKAEGDLIVRAGEGWRDGVVGVATFSADLESPAGYAFQTGSPVISNLLDREEIFRTPALMLEHGVKRAINVLITYGGGRWGVLEVDSSSAGEFEAADLAFLQGLANFIGVALDRQVAEDRLSQALDYQKMLVQEASHRVKNSLAILSSLLTMKARSSKSAAEADALGDASDRVIAVARTHDRLWRDAGGDTIDLGALVTDVCETVGAELDHVVIDCSTTSMDIATDHAASLALLVTELISNAAKHAYGTGGGLIQVRLIRDGDVRVLEVQDEGVGLAQDFTITNDASDQLGMSLIAALTESIDGEIESIAGPGATFRVRF